METAVIISTTSMLATLSIVLLVLLICWKLRKKAEARRTETQDVNPVYGRYYFENGVRIDDSTVEVEDQNALYE